MATIQEVAPAPWRIRLQPASYAGVIFHVEHQGRSSGRRVVVHEYPKRDKPYSEDMGRSVIRYQMTGYLIGPRYHITKKALINALENKAGAPLMDPYIAEYKTCICERYSVTETRERGGYCTFEMSFVELGAPGNNLQQVDSGSQLKEQASTTGDMEVETINGAGTDASVSGQGIGHA
jgi:prophage DNA circulation protein